MAIGNATKKAKTNAAHKAKTSTQADTTTTAPLEGHAERSASLR